MDNHVDRLWNKNLKEIQFLSTDLSQRNTQTYPIHYQASLDIFKLVAILDSYTVLSTEMY